jgi:hypothetical protein
MNEFNPSKENPAHRGDLIPYHFNGPNQPSLYNGVQVVAQIDDKNEDKTIYSAAAFKLPDLDVTKE